MASLLWEIVSGPQGTEGLTPVHLSCFFHLSTATESLLYMSVPASYLFLDPEHIPCSCIGGGVFFQTSLTLLVGGVSEGLKSIYVVCMVYVVIPSDGFSNRTFLTIQTGYCAVKAIYG